MTGKTTHLSLQCPALGEGCRRKQWAGCVSPPAAPTTHPGTGDSARSSPRARRAGSPLVLPSVGDFLLKDFQSYLQWENPPSTQKVTIVLYPSSIVREVSTPACQGVNSFRTRVVQMQLVRMNSSWSRWVLVQ
jgi:hypothetical protein